MKSEEFRQIAVEHSRYNNHAELGRWFDEFCKESDDFDEALMREMQKSWAVASTTPYDVYTKTLYTLV